MRVLREILRKWSFSFLILAMGSSSSCQTSGQVHHPKNVIILIGDGMGYNNTLAADYFFGPSSLNRFPVSLAAATFPAGSGYDPSLAWSDPEYVTQGFTESAAAATALATGEKTSLNRIGLSAGGDTLLNLTELAKQLGKSAGVISSVPFSHATPAGFTVHNSNRFNYKQIAYDLLLRSRCDVVMGCGNPEYDDNGTFLETNWSYAGYVGDSALWQDLKTGSGKQTVFLVNGAQRTVSDINHDNVPDPWTLVTSEADFKSLASGPTPGRVLGCPRVFSTLQQARKFTGGEGNDSPPYMTQPTPGLPTLAEMVRGGLNVLDNNSSGFFLMVEGGAIDWANHANQKGRMLEEMNSFRDAIDAVLQWVRTSSSWDETLVIVTADHECGYLWGGAPFLPVTDHGIGNLPGLKYNSGDHTNSLVAVHAWGQGADLLDTYANETDPVRGPYMQNNEISKAVFKLWSIF
jgi:alkaline phosphatase